MMRSASARRLAADQAGGVAVEFAFVAPIFLTCIVGILMLALAYYEGATVQWSLERSLRAAMVHPGVTAADIRHAIDEDLDQMGIDFDFSYHVEEVDTVQLAVARIAYDAPLHIPFVPDASIRFVAENVAPLATP